jgi:tetratricopeptide (TPR) repeat protein
MKELKYFIPFLGLVFVIGVVSYHFFYATNPQIALNELNETIDKLYKESDEKVERRERILTQFYTRIDENVEDGVYYIDSILMYGDQLSSDDVWLIKSIKGEALYDNDSFRRALNCFNEINSGGARNLVNKASCLAKLKYYDSALLLLDTGILTFSQYKWYVGNIYESMNQPDIATEYYRVAYESDSSEYRYCLDRIKELEDPKTTLFDGVQFRDRRKRLYFTINRGLLIYE